MAEEHKEEVKYVDPVCALTAQVIRGDAGEQSRL